MDPIHFLQKDYSKTGIILAFKTFKILPFKTHAGWKITGRKLLNAKTI